MTVGRFAFLAAFGVFVTAAAARPPSATELEKQYVGQQWTVNYPAIPCSHQTAEVTALKVYNQKANAIKASTKTESVAVDPPGRVVSFTVRCPDGSTYTGKVSLQNLETVLSKPVSR